VSPKVTKRGKAKAPVVSPDGQPKTLWGATKGTFTIKGDIVGPIVEWDEERSLERLALLVEGQNPPGPTRSIKRRKGVGVKSRRRSP
jgi:hypothetical protein